MKLDVRAMALTLGILGGAVVAWLYNRIASGHS